MADLRVSAGGVAVIEACFSCSVRTERVVLNVCCSSLVAVSVTGLGVITVNNRALFVYLLNLPFKA